jgi:hypothetical protein
MRADLENAIHLGLATGGAEHGVAEFPRVLGFWDNPAIGPWPYGADAEVLHALRCVFWERSDQEMSPRDDYAQLSQIVEPSEVVVWAGASPQDQARMIVSIDQLPRQVNVWTVQDGESFYFQKHEKLVNALPHAVQLDAQAIDFAKALARAHGEGDPDNVSMLLPDAPATMPFVAAAYQRLLDDLPAPGSGLTLTERQMLSILLEQPTLTARIFTGLLPIEGIEYFGWTSDSYIFRILEEWERCAVPLVRRQDVNQPRFRSIYEITPAGIDALEGRLDHLAVNRIPRWFGGLKIPSDPMFPT